MLTVGPAGPYRAPKSRRAPGHLPPLPPLSAGLSSGSRLIMGLAT